MEPVSDLAMWSLIVGFLLPPALAVVQQGKWDAKIKAALAFLVSAAAAVGVAYFSDDLTGRTWVSSALVVFVGAISTYQMFWKQTTIAPKIESATDLNRGG